MMRFWFVFMSMFLPVICWGQIVVKETGGEATFPLVSSHKTVIYYDAGDYGVVEKTACLLAEDIKRVTNKKVPVSSKKVSSEYAVVVGTVGRNAFIDRLVAEGQLDVSAIRGGWEQFVVKTIDDPAKGVKKVLVIAGCDRRGTAYGVFTLSEAIGVSPLYWWADVPTKRKSQLYIENINYVSQAPSVQYRGIFINDEGWGITPWAGKTFDKELGDIGPKTYAKVCELILRMKGNMLAPAMHPSSGAFNKYSENKLVADSYGIIMSSSHCEPLLFNNVTEWDKKTMGEWNYITNKGGINKILDRRVSENAPYENIYTIAMRGIHDAGLVGVPKDKEVSLVEEVIADQRGILKQHVDSPLDSIPQIFVPYKEVLDIYERGLKLPEDIMLVWPDDNFGYIKRLNNKEERNRKGGSGVYYHISYLGEPHDYLWLNTTPPALMFEEMRKAYDTGAKRYWLLNVGDIKPGELGMKTFLDMAWDIDKFNFDNINNHQVDFLASIFGEKYREDIDDIMNSYYHLGFQHKPEAMGWGYEWNNEHAQERMTDTDFSFANYNEAEGRMQEYDRISDKSEKIWNTLPESYKAAFYELVFYPVKGAALMNKKMLTAQQNRWYARQGRAATNYLADRTKAYHDSIDYYTGKYNSLLNGKWNHMMALAPGWTATYQKMPPVTTIDVPQKAEMRVFLPGQDSPLGKITLNVLPCVNPYTRKESFIELYNIGEQAFTWNAKVSDSWIKLSRQSGTTLLQERIIVSVDWSKVPVGERVTGEIDIISGSNQEKIYLPVFNPVYPTAGELKGWYVEDNGCVSINPGKFHRKVENEDIKMKVIEGLGYENQCIQLGEATKPVQNPRRSRQAAKVEYDFYTFNAGSVTVYTYALPVFPVNSERGTCFGIMIDDGLLKYASNNAKEYSGEWRENVYRNSTINAVTLNIDKPGKHTLKLICSDPGMIIQKVVIDMGGMKRSYLGPETTIVR